MTTTVTVKANGDCEVKVDRIGNTTTETQIMPRGTTEIFYVHSGMHLHIQEVDEPRLTATP